MLIGIPKELKDHEYRVGATPAVVRMLVEDGHAYECKARPENASDLPTTYTKELVLKCPHS